MTQSRTEKLIKALQPFFDRQAIEQKYEQELLIRTLTATFPDLPKLIAEGKIKTVSFEK